MIADRKQRELRLARRSDLTLVVSPVEKEILEKECPGLDVRVLPTIFPHEERDVPGFADRRGLIFIGGFQHPANLDGIPFFIREILPRILHQLARGHFPGHRPRCTEEILALTSSNVQFLGYVPDVTPLFDRARVSVAPIRFGAGVKGKVNQSMALGVPTVVTSVAAEGMHLVDGQDVLIADDPERFADAVVRLYTSPELWNRLSANGRENVRKHFSVEASAQKVDELLQWAGLNGTSRCHNDKTLRADLGHVLSSRYATSVHGEARSMCVSPIATTLRSDRH